MADANTFSKSEMVLLAAYSKWLESEFTAEELVIACWEKYPDSFGLQGYSDKFPDANVVYRHIMGKNSVVKKQRWLSQKGPKRYALTPAGINHALKILGREGQKTATIHHRVDRYYEQVLLRVLNGSAWAKFKNNQIDAITFTEACDVWSISPRSSGEQYKAAQRDLAVAISIAKRHLDEGSEITLASRINVSAKDLDNLGVLVQSLDAKFKNQLDLISRRSVRWGKITER